MGALWGLTGVVWGPMGPTGLYWGPYVVLWDPI